ncbi:MAG: SRPBCC family protein [Gemmatimonadales bacterium]
MTWVEGRAVTIDRPVQDVWNFMIDISNMPRWEDSGAVWTQTSVGPIGAGTRFQSSVHLLGRTSLFDLRVTAFEPNRVFTVEAIGGFGRGTKISYVIEPVDARSTRLRRLTEPELHGVASLLRPFQALIVRKTASIEANNVKRLLEGQSQ